MKTASRLYSFRFLSDKFNRQLQAVLCRMGVQHQVGSDGAVTYSADDEETVEADIIPSIYSGIFRDWQIVSCPRDWIDRYKSYMEKHGIPFQEMERSGELEFLVPRKHRPHSWKL